MTAWSIPEPFWALSQAADAALLLTARGKGQGTWQMLTCFHGSIEGLRVLFLVLL